MFLSAGTHYHLEAVMKVAHDMLARLADRSQILATKRQETIAPQNCLEPVRYSTVRLCEVGP